MKAVYSWDKDNHLDTINLVEDDYQLAPSETFTKPEDGLYEPISWTGSAWVGVSKEEWEAKHPRKPVEPSADAKVMNTMGIQIANLTKQNQSLSQTVNALGLQIAKMQDTKTANGGN